MTNPRTATILADGIAFGEGPRWREGRLWFSDFYDHAVQSVTAAGEMRVEFAMDDQPSGLGWTPDGICLDAEGAVWVANPGAPECVRVAQGGELLEVVATSLPCYACMLGGGKPRGRIETVAAPAAHAGRP